MGQGSEYFCAEIAKSSFAEYNFSRNHKTMKLCPVCKSPNYTASYVIRGYTYNSCCSCGMMYLIDSQSVSEPVAEHYDSDYFKDAMKKNLRGYPDYAKQSRPLRINFKALLSRINRHVSFDATKSMLDVGCAYGFLLDEARKLGISVHGVDLSESAIKWMNEELDIKGTVGCSYDAPNGPYDLITAIEVIEHIHRPYSFLIDMRERMRDDGILVIHTGANDTLTARMLGKRWWYLNPPDHCSIFSRPALRKLISDTGFAVLEHCLTPYYWVGMNNLVLKLARTFESKQLGRLASKLPALIFPISHYTTQLLIARKR